jgi:hypothetical protein
MTDTKSLARNPSLLRATLRPLAPKSAAGDFFVDAEPNSVLQAHIEAQFETANTLR